MLLTLEVQGDADPQEAAAEAVASLLAELELSGTVEIVERAVPATPGHYQQRTREGRFARPHHSRVTPRDARGRFRQRLSREECAGAVEQAREHLGEFGDRMRGHLRLWRQGKIDPPDFERLAEAEIRHFYPLLYREGKQAVGDPGILLSPQDKAAVGRILRDEIDFLRGFARDLAEGVGTVPYEDRLEMYANALRESFWAGWSLGDQRRGRDLRWRFGGTVEHCGDCQRFVDLGWTPAPKFLKEVVFRGFVPRSGALECKGIRCSCFLQERLLKVVQTVPDLEV